MEEQQEPQQSELPNAADVDKVRDQKRKERRLDKREIEDFKFVLSSAQGRRFIWKLLDDAGVFKQSAHNSGSWTYFNEGQRSVGNRVLAQLMDHDQSAFLKMINEHRKGV